MTPPTLHPVIQRAVQVGKISAREGPQWQRRFELDQRATARALEELVEAGPPRLSAGGGETVSSEEMETLFPGAYHRPQVGEEAS